MALQSLGGKQGFIMSADGGMASSGTANTTLDAAGESRAYIGKVYLAGGTGSKTISSAGGKIWWRTAGTTFANAGTTIRAVSYTHLDVYKRQVYGRISNLVVSSGTILAYYM